MYYSQDTTPLDIVIHIVSWTKVRKLNLQIRFMKFIRQIWETFFNLQTLTRYIFNLIKKNNGWCLRLRQKKSTN